MEKSTDMKEDERKRHSRCLCKSETRGYRQNANGSYRRHRRKGRERNIAEVKRTRQREREQDKRFPCRSQPRALVGRKPQKKCVHKLQHR